MYHPPTRLPSRHALLLQRFDQRADRLVGTVRLLVDAHVAVGVGGDEMVRWPSLVDDAQHLCAATV